MFGAYWLNDFLYVNGPAKVRLIRQGSPLGLGQFRLPIQLKLARVDALLRPAVLISSGARKINYK